MKILNVTRPALPPLRELLPLLEGIWESGVVTNSGEYHQSFENGLKNYLGVKNLTLFNNATIGLMASLKALELKDEIITTPYSFVATAHAISWNNIKPVFVDICPRNFNICPLKVERFITEKTSAILAVHCYGSPCDVDALERLADKYKLKLIFDAAHAFGVKFRGKSIAEFGDASILSFHATKVFNTFEGGAVISSNKEIILKLEKLKNFGFTSETTVEEIGINGKMSEFNSALGLIQLRHIDSYITRRKQIYEAYVQSLKEVPGILIPFDGVRQAMIQNYAYFPVRITSDFPLTRDELYWELKNNGINTRRYFYPIISDFDSYRTSYFQEKKNLTNAAALAEEVLCLPIYPSLTHEQLRRVVDAICSKGCKPIQSNAFVQAEGVLEVCGSDSVPDCSTCSL